MLAYTVCMCAMQCCYKVHGSTTNLITHMKWRLCDCDPPPRVQIQVPLYERQIYYFVVRTIEISLCCSLVN